MRTINKIFQLLSKRQRIEAYVLFFLLLLGMLFEMIGLTIILPFLGAIADQDSFVKSFFYENLLSKLNFNSYNELIYFMLFMLILIYIVKSAFLIFLSWKQLNFSQSISRDISKKLYAHYLRQPYSFHLESNSSDLVKNVVGESSLMSGLMTSCFNIASNLVLMLSIVIMLYIVQPVGTILAVAILLFLSLLYVNLTKNWVDTSGKKRLSYDGLRQKNLFEGLGGIKDVKIYNIENYFLNDFNTHNEASYKIGASIQFVNNLPRYFFELIAVFLLVAIIYLSFETHGNNSALIPILGVFVASAFRLIPAASLIISSIQTWRYTLPSAILILGELRRNILEDFIELDISSEFIFKEIEFSNVSFRYASSDKETLMDANLSIEEGKCIGIVGQSGSGKSTLIDLIIGLHAPSAGSIKVNGVDLLYNIKVWREQIGYVPQNIFLIDSSIKKNIAFCDESVDEIRMAYAVKSAQLEEFVELLPSGMDTLVGERGVRISGGQRQRIGIARAIYRNPQILIFDEATSALDTETEKEVLDSIYRLRGKITIVIVSHRESTLKSCDHVYMVSEGKILETRNTSLIFS